MSSIVYPFNFVRTLQRQSKIQELGSYLPFWKSNSNQWQRVSGQRSMVADSFLNREPYFEEFIRPLDC